VEQERNCNSQERSALNIITFTLVFDFNLTLNETFVLFLFLIYLISLQLVK